MQFSKFKWAICGCCEGHGKVENPAFYNGITDWAEWSDEERESYMSGLYDVPCPDCRGSGKVKVPDVAAMTFAEKRELVLQRIEAREDAEYRRQCAHERAMGY
ncbi:hypothetical protein HWC14_gp52 [Serratia phage Parlo]|uniref:Uncharacterized protein n=1 Tax=Serratia phage Parlo TaxID=2557554 RepID=A0A482MFK8_9CAUD|nr:hypothetical protein HWC14_gp52 [Serratia phage Parlo]QBQ72201.1 hypothetical protein CPT_Parlo_052 [Serratia phage Parlo]